MKKNVNDRYSTAYFFIELFKVKITITNSLLYLYNIIITFLCEGCSLLLGKMLTVFYT